MRGDLRILSTVHWNIVGKVNVVVIQIGVVCFGHDDTVEVLCIFVVLHHLVDDAQPPSSPLTVGPVLPVLE